MLIAWPFVSPITSPAYIVFIGPVSVFLEGSEVGLLELRLTSNFYSYFLSAGITGKCQRTQFLCDAEC